MLATGITLLLNYNVFDVNLLPPLQNTDQGKKTAAIILTCFGLVGILISVIVSLLFLCNKSKAPAIVPKELSQLPPTARGATPVKLIHSDRSELSDRKHSSGIKPHNNSNVTTRPKLGNVKNIPGSAEVKLPRVTKTPRHRNHHYVRRVQRLEGIKEHDAISRKTIDDVKAANDCRDTESLSSEMTIDDQQKIPRIVTDHYDDLIRRSSLDSASPSQASDISNKFVDVDKSRRELQFLPESAKDKDLFGQYDKDSLSLDHYRESFIDTRTNSEDYSINSDISQNQVIALTDFNEFSAGGNNETGTVSSSLADMTDSDKD